MGPVKEKVQTSKSRLDLNQATKGNRQAARGHFSSFWHHI